MSALQPDPILTIDQLSVRRGNVQVLQDVDLRLFPASILALLGWSGSGKSTLLLAVAGLLETTAWVRGNITYNGRSLNGIAPHRRGIPMVLQELGLFAHLSAAENVAYPLKIQGISRRKRRIRSLEMLSRLGIERELADRLPQSMSGGQRQRVALARALVIHPKLVMLDEPTSALDAVTAGQFADLLVSLREEEGFAAFIATHDHNFANRLANRLAVIDKGTIVQADTSQEMHRHPRHPDVVRMLGMRNLLRAEVSAGVATFAHTYQLPLFPEEVDGGGDGYILLHEDRIRLLGLDQDQDKRERGLEVLIVRESWANGLLSYEAELPWGLHIYCPSGQDTAFIHGQRAWLEIPAGACWFIHSGT